MSLQTSFIICTQGIINNTCMIGLLCGLNDLIHVKHLVQFKRVANVSRDDDDDDDD